MSKSEEIMVRINAKLAKKYKGSAPSLMSGSDLPPVSWIPTGLLALDWLNGGGGPRSHVEQIYGKRSSGKTSIVLRRIAEAQRKGLVCAFIDAEHTLDKLWAIKHGVDLDELIIYEPDMEASGEKIMDVVYEMLMGCSIDLIVIDSVPGLCPQAKIDGSMEDKHYTSVANVLSMFFDKVIGPGVLYNSDCNLIFINQPRQVIGSRIPMTRLPGGSALEHYSSIITEVKKDDWIFESSSKDAPKIGIDIKIINQKNKIRWPFKEHTLKLYFAGGFNPLSEVILFGQKYDLIESRGNWAYYGEEEMGNGLNQQMSWLMNNKEIYKELRAKILEKIAEGKY